VLCGVYARRRSTAGRTIIITNIAGGKKSHASVVSVTLCARYTRRANASVRDRRRTVIETYYIIVVACLRFARHNVRVRFSSEQLTRARARTPRPDGHNNTCGTTLNDRAPRGWYAQILIGRRARRVRGSGAERRFRG